MTFQDEFPIGFTMSLAQHTDILTQFASLPPDEQQRIVDGSRQMKSRQEMHNYVDNMFQGLGRALSLYLFFCYFVYYCFTDQVLVINSNI